MWEISLREISKIPVHLNIMAQNKTTSGPARRDAQGSHADRRKEEDREDVKKFLTYPSKPKFAVMEHSMDVAGRVLYERREAHIYRDEEKQRQSLVVLIVRSIDDKVLKTIVRRSDGEDDQIEDLGEVGDDDKGEFYRQWAGLWVPKMPDEESATPVMLEIAHMEPYPILYPTEEYEGSVVGAEELERRWRQGSDGSPREKGEGKEVVKDSGDTAAAAAEEEKKRGTTKKRRKKKKKRTLTEVEEEVDRLEKDLKDLRVTERRLKGKLTEVQHDEDDIRGRVDRLQGKLSTDLSKRSVQAEVVNRERLDGLLQKLESEVLNTKAVEEKMKNSVRDVVTEEQRLQGSVRAILENIKEVKEEEEKLKQQEQEILKKLGVRLDSIKSGLQKEKVDDQIAEIKEAAEAFKRLKSVIYRTAPPDGDDEVLPEGGESIKFRVNVKNSPKRGGAPAAQREAEDDLEREERSARRSHRQRRRSPSPISRPRARPRRRYDEEITPRTVSTRRGSYRYDSPTGRRDSGGREERRDGSRRISRDAHRRRRRERSPSREAGPRHKGDSNFSRTLSPSERVAYGRKEESRRKYYDTSISRRGEYEYGAAKAKMYPPMKQFTIYKPKHSVDMDKSTNTSRDTSRRSNHSQVTIKFED